MNGYLLDTNVVSELRKPRPHGGVVAWLNNQEEEYLFLSAVTMGELQEGIERARTDGRLGVCAAIFNLPNEIGLRKSPAGT